MFGPFDVYNYREKIRQSRKKINDEKLGEIKPFKVSCWVCYKEFEVMEREFTFPNKQKYYCCKSCANTHDAESTKKQSDKIKLLMKTSPTYYHKSIQNLTMAGNNKRSSSVGERALRVILKDRYGASNVLAHRKINGKSVDIYMKERNIVIEYDGVWHFNKEIYDRFGQPDRFYEVQKKDQLLKEYCQINNIRLLRISEKYYLKNKSKSISNIIDFIEVDESKYKELY